MMPKEEGAGMSETSADNARKGLGATLAGKAKEVAGAALGNDSLAAEGQLQQAEAAALKESSTTDAVAQAEAKQAAAALASEHSPAEERREAAAAAANARVDQVQRDSEVERARVQAQTEADRVAEKARVDAEAQAQLQQSAHRAAQDKPRLPGSSRRRCSRRNRSSTAPRLLSRRRSAPGLTPNGSPTAPRSTSATHTDEGDTHGCPDRSQDHCKP